MARNDDDQRKIKRTNSVSEDIRQKVSDIEKMDGPTVSGSGYDMGEAEMQEILKIQQDPSGSEITQNDSQPEKPDDVSEDTGPKSYVRVSDDRMEAWIYFSSSCGPMRRNELLKFLKDNNVMRGYLSSTFTKAVKSPEFDRELMIASGREPDEGRDGYYEFFFEPEKYHVPRIMEDGSVDYASMNRLANVHAGDVVAVYHPAVQGQDGFNVRGDVLKARITRELPPMYGKEIARDGNRYMAKVDGKIEEHHGHVDIQQVHEVHGDVGAVVGKIEFFGDVVVYGNVEEGAVIRAGRNIDVRGTAAGAVLSAGGDIIVTRGITGSGSGKVTARGNLMSDFIENARVEIQGNITTNSILNSYVSAGGEVMVCGQKSVIIGGYTHGFRGIKAENVGNETEKKTVLHTGYEVNLYDSYIDMKRREVKIKRDLSAIVAQITNQMQSQRILNLKKKYGSDDDSENAADPQNTGDVDNTEAESDESELSVSQKIAAWTKQKNDLFNEIEQIRPVRERLEEKIMLAQQAKIEVSGHIYTGTVISLNDKKLVVNKNTSFMKYSINSGIIESKVMVL